MGRNYSVSTNKLQNKATGCALERRGSYFAGIRGAVACKKKL